MKRVLFLFFASLLSLTTWAAVKVTVIAVPNDDGVTIYYELSAVKGDNSAFVTYDTSNTSYNSYSGDVVIPSSVEDSGITYDVTGVNANAFYLSTGLTSVTLPESTTYVQVNAFGGCTSLQSITVLATDAPYCYDGAFNDLDTDACVLYVPEGCVDAYSVSDGWKEFTKIKVIGDEEDDGTPLADGTKFQVDGLYYYVDSSEEKTVQVTYGGSSATSGTVSYTGDITIPEKVKYEGVTYTVVGIDTNAFYSCALTSMTAPATVTEIGNMAFGYCSSLKSLSLSEGLLSIGIDTFRDCTSLEEVDIPNSVTLINSYAFRNCTGLKHATLSEGLTSIANCTFYGCSSLEEITIPKNVTLVNMQAFGNCTSLMSVTSPNLTPPETYAWVFEGVNTDECVLYVPQSAVEIYARTTTWQDFTHIEGIPDEVGDRIEVDDIYYNIVSTTTNTVEVTWGGESSTSGTETYVGDISIPSTVDYGDNTYTVVGIGENAFHNCGELTSVTMTETVTYINEYAFRGTTKAAIVEIGSGVTTIGGSAFYESGLTEITIPASVKTIGNYAFAYSDKLEKVVIENDFTGMGAFRYCTSLKDVDLGHVTSIAERTFEFCDALEYITIPETVTSIGMYTFYYCTGLKEITIPDSVTYMEGWVIFTCTSLEKGTIGEGLTSLQQSQFFDCSNLKEVSLGSKVSDLKAGFCMDCTSLERIYVLNPTPPSCASHDMFTNVPTDNCILYVPKGSKSNYASASVWKNFVNIVEIGNEDTDGISGVSVSASGADVTGYYSVDGQLLSTSQKGVNIVRYTDGTTKKILIK